MKKVMLFALTAMVAGLVAAPVAGLAEEGTPAVAPAQTMTQGQFAQLMIQKLGMHRHLPLNPSDLECVALLMQLGIFPGGTVKDGWNPEATLTTIDVARVLVRALGLESQVGDPSKDEDWIKALEKANVTTEDVVTGVSTVRTVREVFLSFLTSGLTQDPLYKNPIAESVVQGALDAINLPDIVVPDEDLPKPKPPTPTLESKD